jgi:cytochrome P450
MSTLMQANLVDPDLFPAEKGPPHRLFDAWRSVDPVHWNPPNPDYEAPVPGDGVWKGFWVLTRYKDVLDVSMNQDLFSSYEEGIVIWDLSPESLERNRSNFMMMRPADHSAVRKVINPPFMPSALKGIEPRIADVARRIVDEVAPRGECEFVFDVAARLPVFTFCELMGIPEHQREAVADFGNALADVETRSSHSLDPLIGLNAIAMELAEEKRRNPDDGLMSAMVNDATLNLSDMAISEFFLVFAMAGHETTRSTAAHFINLMHHHPDQYELLREDFEGRIDNAIDEVLRYTSTTTNFRRTATADTEIGGHPVKAGDKILLSYAAANRDPTVFDDPHRFDILRPNAKRHLAFGVGPHICIGARLAKMQLRALIREVVTRLPDIRLSSEPEWLRSIWFNAIIRMPVTFSPV